MTRREPSSSPPATAIARWNRTLLTLADNDNIPVVPRGRFLALAVGLPLFSTATVVGCLVLMASGN